MSKNTNNTKDTKTDNSNENNGNNLILKTVDSQSSFVFNRIINTTFGRSIIYNTTTNVGLHLPEYINVKNYFEDNGIEYNEEFAYTLNLIRGVSKFSGKKFVTLLNVVVGQNDKATNDLISNEYISEVIQNLNEFTFDYVSSPNYNSVVLINTKDKTLLSLPKFMTTAFKDIVSSGVVLKNNTMHTIKFLKGVSEYSKKTFVAIESVK